MKVTNFEKLYIFWLVILVSCNPCEDDGGDPRQGKYVIIQSNSQDGIDEVFRFDYETFKLREVSSTLKLGKSNTIEKSILFNNDSIFILDKYSLKSSLIFDNVPGINVKTAFLTKDGGDLLILSIDSILYKSDLSNNVEFIDNNFSCSEIFINSFSFAYWKENKNLLVLRNIQNTLNVNKSFNFNYEKLSDIVLNQESVVFSNYNDIISKVYFLDFNLAIVDTMSIELGRMRPVLVKKELYLYNDSALYYNANVLYRCSLVEKIEKVYFSSKNEIIYLFIIDNLSGERSIYYSLLEEVNFKLLINNAEAVD